MSVSTSHNVKKTFHYTDGDTMTFDLDNCEMTIEKNSASIFEVYVNTQNDPQVVVTVNAEEKYVSVAVT